jgi:hypothetical protein
MTASGLQAVHAVGGVVPPSLLARIQAGELKNTTGLAPASYHLAGRETVRDAASRAWSYLRGAWIAWREHAVTQPASGPGTRQARERWLLVLLRELGYGQVPALPGGYTVDGRDYPVSHAWQHVPIHLLGPGVDLDRRNPGVSGAARAPQAMVQEFLNRSAEHLWAILSNGLRLRLLRDSTALAGSAYLEFDLETIFDGELYPEFLLLWQLCHVSRLERRVVDTTPRADATVPVDATPASYWIEDWRAEAVDAGTRMLDRLRTGVEAALDALGTGFLRHPANRPLVDALRAGELSTRDYHRALLRLAYRLLFCFVAEDRDALLRPEASAQARARFEQYFSTTRMRRLSRIRAGSPHGDLWQAQVVVLRALGGHGHDGIGLPGLAGLFDPDPRLPKIDGCGPDLLLGCSLANEDLLDAVRNLAWLSLPNERVQPVDYRNLDAEELGSVYESLLELVPRIDLAEHTFHLDNVAGNERKTTGSYYTPPSLVSALLDTALDPLLDEAVGGARDQADAEARLLALTVCDPACGSGHFLVAAARRIARRLAQCGSDDSEPTPAQVQHALREVVGHCIYGVDINDLAAELAKVSLWLEALEPGKPLGFLDARIRVGNSLLGTTPALLKAGVPDAAFKDLDGDDKVFAAAVRKRNKQEAKGQDLLFFGDARVYNTALADERADLLALPDDVDEVRKQAEHADEYEHSTDYLARKIHADVWSAAFMWPLNQDAPEPPTDAVVRLISADPSNASHAATVAEAERIAVDYRFFHWYLEFPEIFRVTTETAEPHGWLGGFSCILGNPPWERVKLQEKEFFAARHPEIANARNAAARKTMISALEGADGVADRALFTEWTGALRVSNGFSGFIRESGRYPLTATGDINTYAVFAETARSFMNPTGRLGIVPTGIATDATTQRFFRDLVETESLVALYDFENEDKVFPTVHHSYRFALLTLAGRGGPKVSLAFRTRQANQIAGRAYSISPAEILLLNPNTGTCPVFTSRRDAEITLGIYHRVPVLWRDGGADGNPWGLSFMAMLHMANDSGHFRTAEELDGEGWTLRDNCYERDAERMLPLYEAKMAHHFDHRFSTYEGATQEQLNVGTLPRFDEPSHADPARLPKPRYWVPEDLVEKKLAAQPDSSRPPWNHGWLLGWRDIARSSDERTVIAAVVPRSGVGDKLLLALPAGDAGPYLANLSAFVLDYVARQKYSGVSLKYYVMKQLPVLPPAMHSKAVVWDGAAENLGGWIAARVVELTYTAYDVVGFARDLGDEGSPFVWDDARRMLMRAELDAAYFHLYGVVRDDVDYIMDTFKVVRERDVKVYGEFRTKRLILEIYDAMQEAVDTGMPYKTVLDPPPGKGRRHPERKES